MQIVHLHAENFMSYEVLDLNLADRGLVLIEGDNQDTGGSNGAGKSAIFEALVWGLFGVTNRGLRGDEIVRRDESRSLVNDTIVCVQIAIDGQIVHAIRHRNHSQFKNKLLLFVGDNEITMGSDRETQERLNSLLQIDRDAFIAAVMFPQNAEGFASLTDSGQKAILDRILGMERFTDAQERIKEKLRTLGIATTRAETRRLAAENAIQSAKKIIADTEQTAKDWDRAHAESIQAAEVAIKKMDGEKPTLSVDVEKEIRKIEESGLDEAEEKCAAAKREFADRKVKMTTEYDFAVDQVNTLHDLAEIDLPEPPKASATPIAARTNAEAWQAIVYDSRSKLNQLANEGKRNREQLSENPEVCPTCGQKMPVDDHWKEQLERRHAEILKECEELNRKHDEAETNAAAWKAEEDKAVAYKQWQELSERAEKAKRDFAAAQETAKKKSQEMRVAVEAYNAIVLQYGSILEKKRRLQELRQIVHKFDREFSDWKLIRESLISKKRAIEEAKNPYPGMVEKLQATMRDHEHELATSRSLQDVLTQQIRYLKFWENGFGNAGVKSLLLDTVTPFLTNRANEYLEILTNDGATIEFQTQSILSSGKVRDKFAVSVNYLYGGDSYQSVSGGERRRVDLAALFALGDLAASRSLAPVRLRLLDEPFDNLDALGAEQVVRILQELVLPSCGTVLVMTHDDNLKSLIERHFTVVKSDGVSTIVE